MARQVFASKFWVDPIKRDPATIAQGENLTFVWTCREEARTNLFQAE
jgi:hypothetical protein